MRAGELRRRVSFQMPNQAQDTAGQAVRRFTPFCTAWAKVEAYRGRLKFVAEKTTQEELVKVTTRYRADLGKALSPDWRIAYGSRTLGIVSFQDTEERHRELVLVCRELKLGEPV